MATTNRAIARQPRTWPEIQGQDFIVARLIEMLATDHHLPAMLFSGKHGCGKTCSAILYAMTQFCLNPKDLTPCWACEACQKVLNNCWEDYLFVDGQGNRSLEYIRGTLMPFLTRAPFRSRRKIVIIDEIHCYLEPAQSAFLTTFETLTRIAPETTVIGCTTTPKKLLPALRSRCTPFHFQAMPDELVMAILRKDRPDLPTPVLTALLEASDNSLRQAYSILDQVQGQAVTEASVHRQSGTLTRAERQKLWGLIAAGNAQKVATAWQGLVSRHLDFELVGNQLIEDLTEHIAFAPTWERWGNVLHQLGVAQSQNHKTLWLAALYSALNCPPRPDLTTPEGIRQYLFS